MKLRAGLFLILVTWATVFGQDEDIFDEESAANVELKPPPPAPPVAVEVPEKNTGLSTFDNQAPPPQRQPLDRLKLANDNDQQPDTMPNKGWNNQPGRAKQSKSRRLKNKDKSITRNQYKKKRKGGRRGNSNSGRGVNQRKKKRNNKSYNKKGGGWKGYKKKGYKRRKSSY